MAIKIKIRHSKEKAKFSALPGIAEKFKAIQAQLSNTLIGREQELAGLALCLLTKENMLLDGPHGTAKSRIAEDFFRRISDANIFDLQLMKGTQPDELFGPLDAELYRRKAEWRRNTRGMLPECDLAILDEVYRASEMLLPATMRILNERYYMNGPMRMECPMTCALGTTNFVTDSPELEAVHDRWLIRIKVAPLSSSAAKLRMLVSEFARLSRPEEQPEPVTITMAELRLLQRAVNQVTLDAAVMELYEETVAEFRKNMNQVYVSDRRLVKALRLAQADFVLNQSKPFLNGVSMAPENLSATYYAFAFAGAEQAITKYTEAYETIIGNYERSRREDDEFGVITKAINDAKLTFDPKMRQKDAVQLRSTVHCLISGLDAIPPDRRPQSQKNIEALQSALSDLTNLATSLAQIIKA